MQVARATPAHFGIFVFDLPMMVNFYQQLFHFTVTDRGLGPNFGNELVFFSASENHHHQFVLSAGRRSAVSTLMQASFMVPSLEELRRIRHTAATLGATQIRSMNHGNAWSVYFYDPEENLVEVYMDTPFHVSQPYGTPLDLERTEAELIAETERLIRDEPTFSSMSSWRAQFENHNPNTANLQKV